jgi:cytidylate kinase
MIAERLGYDLLDTGAIYRTLALLAHRQVMRRAAQEGSETHLLPNAGHTRFDIRR